MNTNTFEIRDRLAYNDGRPGHVDVGATVIDVKPDGMLVQFDDRADTDFIRFNEPKWMDHIENFGQQHWSGEFSIDHAVPIAISRLVKEGKLKDCSWHNDANPSFNLPGDDAGNVVLWVEHPDPKMREVHQESRFYVLGGAEWDYPTLYAGDDLDAALAKLNEYQGKFPRFVLNVGAIYQLYPDLPQQNGDEIVLWDRQEKQPVFTLHGPYAQAICLETVSKSTGMSSDAISALERWFNHLSNVALDSENLPITKL